MLRPERWPNRARILLVWPDLPRQTDGMAQLQLPMFPEGVIQLSPDLGGCVVGKGA
jgi:hypothetical protein